MWEVEWHQLDIVGTEFSLVTDSVRVPQKSSPEKNMEMCVQLHVRERKTVILSLSEGPGEDAAKGLHSSAGGLEHCSLSNESPV